MTPRRVVIAHTAVDAGADLSTLDVLDQVTLVTEGLCELGIPCEIVAVHDGRVWEIADRFAGAIVVNLLEAPPGAPHLHTAATAALELLDVPFTGNGSYAMWLTTDKAVTRTTLVEAGLQVAPGGRLDLDHPTVLDHTAPPWILKPGWEDASIGLEGDPVCHTREGALARGRDFLCRFPGQPIVVEHVLPGREFNIAVIEIDGAPVVLPPAEMTFLNWPEGKPRVLGYEAKWIEGSVDFDTTRRHFLAESDEGVLPGELRRLACGAWSSCGLSGYARVDMRLDIEDRPCILEVNSNPCLSDGAGFMVAAQVAGMTPGKVVEALLHSAERRWETTHR